MIREGHGIVRLRGGDTYEGNYSIAGSWVTLTGRHRKTGAAGATYYGQRRVWTWPERRILAVVDEPEAGQ
jgi:hypothetical protein